MKKNLRNLLDKIYELEGLVHLALKRDDSSDVFLRLISKKGKEIGDLTASLKSIDSKSSDKNPSKNRPYSFDEYSLDDNSEQKRVTKPNEEIDTPPLEAEIMEEENYQPIPWDREKEEDQQKGKLVFSINDRFRFRKELFDNSDADFNNTLALVASMENYEEAEEYFINEEGFDPSKPVVTEFMAVIKKYFK